jgi:flagellar L-ring protein FlgH
MQRTLLAALTLALALTATVSGESLWPADDSQIVALVADNKAHRVGDIVTVIVQEAQSVKNKSTIKLKKDTTDKFDVSDVHAFEKTNLMDQNRFKADATSSRTLDGEGNFQIANSIDTHVTCMVIAVLPNGNLVVEGSRMNDAGRERQTFRISGVLRPQDITYDNRVYSTQLADAKVVVETSGAITRSTEHGWLGRILDFVWPF